MEPIKRYTNVEELLADKKLYVRSLRTLYSTVSIDVFYRVGNYLVCEYKDVLLLPKEVPDYIDFENKTLLLDNIHLKLDTNIIEGHVFSIKNKVIGMCLKHNDIIKWITVPDTAANSSEMLSEEDLPF